METKIIDGKLYAAKIKQELAEKVAELLNEGCRAPHLAGIILGNDGAAETYIAAMEKNCKEVGFTFSSYKFPKTISQNDFFNALDFINEDGELDGYIIQMPLPGHISSKELPEHINPDKDIDCFHPSTNGKLMLGEPAFPPATAQGVMMLLEHANIETEGKHCVVVGRSNIVGTPLSIMLSRNRPHANATVTLCHSKTRNLKEVCAAADILIVAIGKPEMITEEYIKPGAVVIDVGIHRIEDSSKPNGYRLCGDVAFESALKKAGRITPVPGGVGSMTMVALLQNTLNAYLQKHG